MNMTTLWSIRKSARRAPAQATNRHCARARTRVFPVGLAAGLLLFSASAMAAAPADVVIRYATTNELATIVLPKGQMALVENSAAPAEVRIGDGTTAGGIRIGDGGAAGFANPATEDLDMGGNRIALGDGYEILRLGSWAMLSGAAELTGTNAHLYISVHGQTLVDLYSSMSGAHIESFEWNGSNFVATIGNLSVPTLQWSTNLPSATWTDFASASRATNGTLLTIAWAPPVTNADTYFRAMYAPASQTVFNVSGTVQQNGTNVALAGHAHAGSSVTSAVALATTATNALSKCTTLVCSTAAAYFTLDDIDFVGYAIVSNQAYYALRFTNPLNTASGVVNRVTLDFAVKGADTNRVFYPLGPTSMPLTNAAYLTSTGGWKFVRHTFWHTNGVVRSFSMAAYNSTSALNVYVFNPLVENVP